jgi:outer membrane protein
MKLIPQLLCATLALAPLTAAADLMGLYLGVGSWQGAPTGSIGRTDIDLDSTLNLDQESNGFAYIAIEHPVPVLPNLRVQHSEMNWRGNALISAGTDLNGNPFTTTQQADITLDLTHTDATVYYELLDNIIDLDLGLTARLFEGEASLVGAAQQESIALEAVVPMLYGKLGVSVPTTGLAAELSANWVNVDEFRLIDWSAQLCYEFDLLPAMDAGIILGYRSQLIEMDDLDELQSDARFEGYFLALQLHF